MRADSLDVGFGLSPGATGGRTPSDGVRFFVAVAAPDGTVLEEVWSTEVRDERHLTARLEVPARHQRALSEGTLLLMLGTDPGANVQQDWAYWDRLITR
jgi:hypothetical protein